MILENTARFWPAGVDQTKVLPSFSLKSPRESIGIVSTSWQLKPVFGTHQDLKYAYVDVPAEVDLYGTGEVTGRLMRNGYKIVLSNKDNPYAKADQLYQSHPWVLGSASGWNRFRDYFRYAMAGGTGFKGGYFVYNSSGSPGFSGNRD